MWRSLTLDMVKVSIQLVSPASGDRKYIITKNFFVKVLI